MITLRVALLAALAGGMLPQMNRTLRQSAPSLAELVRTAGVVELQAHLTALQAELGMREVRRVSVDARGGLAAAGAGDGGDGTPAPTPAPTAEEEEGEEDDEDEEEEDDDDDEVSLDEFPEDFDCANWTLQGKQIVLHSVRIKLIVPGTKAWQRTKPLSNCDCMQNSTGVPGDCICRMVRTADGADAADWSLAQQRAATKPEEDPNCYPNCGGGNGNGNGNGGNGNGNGGNGNGGNGYTAMPTPSPTPEGNYCPMKFTWSQYEQITTCDCTGCTFQKQSGNFISRCQNCDCADSETTQCIPGFFTIRDRPNISDWEAAGNFFEVNMCVVRGRHPPSMCRKMRCETFGGKSVTSATVVDTEEYCNGSSTWVSTAAPEDWFAPDPAYCRILDVLKEAHFAHHYGIAGITDAEATDSLQEDLWTDVAENNPVVAAAERAEMENNGNALNLGGTDPYEASSMQYSADKDPAELARTDCACNSCGEIARRRGHLIPQCDSVDGQPRRRASDVSKCASYGYECSNETEATEDVQRTPQPTPCAGQYENCHGGNMACCSGDDGENECFERMGHTAGSGEALWNCAPRAAGCPADWSCGNGATPSPTASLLEDDATKKHRTPVRSSKKPAKSAAAMKKLVGQHRHTPKGRMALVETKADATMGDKGGPR